MNRESYGIITGLTEEYAGRRLLLYADETIWFGSDPRNDTFLTGGKISPLHCGVSYDPESSSFWIACESEFGVFEEGEGWIRKGTEVRLPSGTQIRIGNYMFVLSCADAVRESGYYRNDAGNDFYRDVPEEGYDASEAEWEYEYYRTKNRSEDDGYDDASYEDDDSSGSSRRKPRIAPVYIGVGEIIAGILLSLCIGIGYVLSGFGNNVDNIVEVNKTSADSVSVETEQEEALLEGESNSAQVTSPEEFVDQVTVYDKIPIESGSCGDNLTWVLYNDGLLVISGDGEMSKEPFKNIQEDIISVVIESGAVNIGEFAFYNCTNLDEVSVPDTVRYISEGAFMSCESLINVDLPCNLVNIFVAAFSGCTSLTSVTIPKSVKRISNQAFLGCQALTDVYYEGTEDEWNAIKMDSGTFALSMHYTVHYNSKIEEK